MGRFKRRLLFGKTFQPAGAFFLDSFPELLVGDVYLTGTAKKGLDLVS